MRYFVEGLQNAAFFPFILFGGKWFAWSFGWERNGIERRKEHLERALIIHIVIVCFGSFLVVSWHGMAWRFGYPFHLCLYRYSKAAGERLDRSISITYGSS